MDEIMDLLRHVEFSHPAGRFEMYTA